MIKSILILTASVLLAASGTGNALASDSMQGRPDVRDRYTADEARDARRSGNVLPALQVIRDVREAYPGAEVLDAELERGDQPRYIIKILTRDGRRVDVIVDARTGTILYER